MKEAVRPWTAVELGLLQQLVDGDARWPYIARILKRTEDACKVRFYEYRRSCQREHAAILGSSNKLISRRNAEAKADAAREARAIQPVRSLTAELCGDPLPGRSALDQRVTAEPPKITLPSLAVERC